MADQLTLGDLVFKLGFESEDEFLRALDALFNQTDEKAKSAGGVGGKEFGEAFRKGAKASADGFGKDFTNALGIQTLGTFLGSTLANAFQSGLAAVQQFVSQSNKEFLSYRLSINQAVAGGVKDLAAFEAQIKALSDASQSFSEQQIALAVGRLVQQGYSAANAFELVKKSVDLARASVDPATGELGDLADAGVKLSNVLEGFELPFEKAGYAADLLAKAAQNSGLEVNDLIGIVADVGSTAKGAGVSLEEVAAAAGVLSQKGISAGEIATRIGTALSALVGPPQQVAKEFDKLGISLIKADGTTRPFAETLDNLNRITSAGGKGLKFLNDALDTYQARALQSLGQSSSDIQAFAGDLRNADGSAKDLADTLTQGVQPVFNYRREIANAQKAIGEGLNPVLLRLYKDILPPLIRALEQVEPLLTKLANAVDRYLQGDFKPGAKSALEAVYTDAVAADNALTRLDDNIKKRDGLKKLLKPVLPGTTLLPDQAALKNQTERALKEVQAQIDKDKAILEGLKRSNQKTDSGADTGTPARTPRPTSDAPIPSNFRANKDPVVEQAQELDKALRLLELRFQDQKIPLGQYQGELTKLEGRFEALGKSAKTTDQQLAVQQGLDGIRQAREKLNKQADPFETLKNSYELGRVPQEQYRAGLVKLLDAYEKQLGQVKAGSPEWQKLASSIKAAGDEIGRLDKAVASLQQRDVSPKALFREGERVLPADTQQRAAAAGAEAGIAFRQAIDRVLEGRFSTTDSDIQDLFDAITTAALNNVPRAKEALKKLEAAFSSSGEAAGAGFVKALDKNLSFSDEQTKAEDLARSIGAMFDLGTQQGVMDALEALGRANLKDTAFFKNLGGGVREVMIANLQGTAPERFATPKADAEFLKSLDEAQKGLRQAGEEFAGGKIFSEQELGGLESTVEFLRKVGVETGAWLELLRQIRVQVIGINTLAGTAPERFGTPQADLDFLKSLADARKTLQDAQEKLAAGGMFGEGDVSALEAALKVLEKAGVDTTALAEGLNRVRIRMLEIQNLTGTDPRRFLPFGGQALDVLGDLEKELGLAQQELKAGTISSEDYQKTLVNTLAYYENALAAISDQGSEKARQLKIRIAGLADELRGLQNGLTVLPTIGGIFNATGDIYGNPIPQTQNPLEDVGKQLGGELTTVAGDFIRDLTDGTPDVGSALRKALGSASDFFLQQMLQGILGPIAQAAGQALAGSLFGSAGGAAALGPLGLIVGGGLLLGSLLLGGGGKTSAEQARSASTPSSGGASSITYSTELNFNVPYVGSLADPTFRAQLRDYVFQILEEFECRLRPAGTGATT